MGVATGDSGTSEEERIDILLEHSEDLLNQRKEIISVFDNTVASDLRFNNLDEFFRLLSGCLYGYVDEDDVSEVAEAIANTVVAYSTESADRLMEEGEDGEKLHSFLTELEANYKIHLERRTNRLHKGNDWWSNVKTEMGYRANKPHFRHEITKDYQDQVVISTDPQNTLTLAAHFLRQVLDARETLGEDVLDYISPELVQDVEELSSELADVMEEYPDDIEEELSEE